MFTFDDPRARVMLKRIYAAYMNETHLFRYVHSKNGDAPQQKFIPLGVERGSPRHIMFLFFANLLTYRSSSDVGFRQVKQVYEIAPEAFSEKVVKHSEKFIQGLLEGVGFVHPNEGGIRWHGSAKTLFDRYGGDPLAIFRGRKSIEEIIAIKNKEEKFLNGLGPKLLSLLAIFYWEIEAIGHIEGVFPVDMHIQNECMGLGLMTADTEVINATRLAEFLRPRIERICQTEKMFVGDLSHAMWFLGSRVCKQLCRRKPGQAELLCPVYEECAGRIWTKSYRKRGKWGLEERPDLPLFDFYNK